LDQLEDAVVQNELFGLPAADGTFPCSELESGHQSQIGLQVEALSVSAVDSSDWKLDELRSEGIANFEDLLLEHDFIVFIEIHQTLDEACIAGLDIFRDLLEELVNSVFLGVVDPEEEDALVVDAFLIAIFNRFDFHADFHFRVVFIVIVRELEDGLRDDDRCIFPALEGGGLKQTVEFSDF
jgi:hypothetical protein